jgi:hypothetical protein
MKTRAWLATCAAVGVVGLFLGTIGVAWELAMPVTKRLFLRIGF